MHFTHLNILDMATRAIITKIAAKSSDSKTKITFHKLLYNR